MEEIIPIENEINNNENEFQVVKNDRVYNIKVIKEEKDILPKIKIVISFILNNAFEIYESYMEQDEDIKTIDDSKEIYQQIILLIKENNIEIEHNDNEKCIILKLEINDDKKDIKLLPVLADDKNKVEQLTKNFISLEKQYIQIKKEKENNQIQHRPIGHLFDDYNSDNSNDNSNNNDDNNDINKALEYENPDEKHILLKTSDKIWCMLKLNKINYIEDNISRDLNLVALGLGSLNRRIIIINLNTLQIHQELLTSSEVYSLTQFKDDSKYLICSLENGKLIIYTLEGDKYQEYQIVEKPLDLHKGEINKVITLSDGNLATAERGAISIWKPKIEKELKNFEFFHEIVTDDDTCHLLEVNSEVFACAIYNSQKINVYKNDGKEYPLLGTIDDVSSHGYDSNAMAKINDNIFCSGGKKCSIYIVSVNPVQLLQKIILFETLDYIYFLHKSNDGFIFTSLGEEIIQYKIINDEDGNFIRLEKFREIEDGNNNSAIITTDDGKIFYKQRYEEYNRSMLFLSEYNKLE